MRTSKNPFFRYSEIPAGMKNPYISVHAGFALNEQKKKKNKKKDIVFHRVKVVKRKSYFVFQFGFFMCFFLL